VKRIVIATDFSDAPWGRFPADGDFCGETFRKKLLLPALRENEQVEVSFDGVEGLGSSFLDEGFAGLIKHGEFSQEELKHRLTVTTSNPDFKVYVDLVWHYINEEADGARRLEVAS
jgi:hypothetical protein